MTRLLVSWSKSGFYHQGKTEKKSHWVCNQQCVINKYFICCLLRTQLVLLIKLQKGPKEQMIFSLPLRSCLLGIFRLKAISAKPCHVSKPEFLKSHSEWLHLFSPNIPGLPFLGDILTLYLEESHTLYCLSTFK